MTAPAAAGQGPAPQPARSTRRPRDVPGTAAAGNPRPAPAAEPFPADTRRVADQGAGVILGVLLWGWVILPLLKGGPTEVKNVIRAKFVNKAKDGSWLP